MNTTATILGISVGVIILLVIAARVVREVEVATERYWREEVEECLVELGVHPVQARDCAMATQYDPDEDPEDVAREEFRLMMQDDGDEGE